MIDSNSKFFMLDCDFKTIPNWAINLLLRRNIKTGHEHG